MSTSRFFVLSVLLLAQACTQTPRYQAQVDLKIDGQDHSFSTSSAQIDRLPGEETLSFYLLRDPGQEAEPSLFVRHFQGNPVAKLWLRYNKPGATDGRLARYSCYMPSTLRDGRATLGWTKADGRPRDRSETGDPDCAVEVQKNGAAALIRVRARLKNEHEDKDESGAKIADTVGVEARVRMQGVY